MEEGRTEQWKWREGKSKGRGREGAREGKGVRAVPCPSISNPSFIAKRENRVRLFSSSGCVKRLWPRCDFEV